MSDLDYWDDPLAMAAYLEEHARHQHGSLRESLTRIVMYLRAVNSMLEQEQS